MKNSTRAQEPRRLFTRARYSKSAQRQFIRQYSALATAATSPVKMPFSTTAVPLDRLAGPVPMHIHRRVAPRAFENPDTYPAIRRGLVRARLQSMETAKCQRFCARARSACPLESKGWLARNVRAYEVGNQCFSHVQSRGRAVSGHSRRAPGFTGSVMSRISARLRDRRAERKRPHQHAC